MSEQNNKSVVHRFIEEGLNQRNTALIDEVYSADYSGHDPERPAPRTIADLKQGMAVLLGKVFPDAQYSIERLVAEGDLVAWHWTFRATHQGEILGIPLQESRSVLAESISFAYKMAKSWKIGFIETRLVC